MKSAIKYSLIFWVVIYVIMGFSLSAMADPKIISIRLAAFMIPQMVLFYYNMVILLPRYHEKGKKTTYYTTLLIWAVIFTTCFGYIDIYFDKILPLTFHHMEDRPTFFIFLGRFMSWGPPIVVGALIRKSILLQRKTKESLELQNKMLAAETKALKAQINPHFLFNTLNNIYSLSQFNNEKTGEAILQLSDILRYVTYEGDQKLVSLSAELEHIRSFIKLQRLRDDDDSNIFLKIEIDDNTLQISPLLLIPFIENSFKHSNHHDKVNGWIKIAIHNEGHMLTMEVSNSTSLEACPKDKVGGVGMENVKRRLSLLYPNKHDLVLRMDKFSYGSTLKINLKE